MVRVSSPELRLSVVRHEDSEEYDFYPFGDPLELLTRVRAIGEMAHGRGPKFKVFTSLYECMEGHCALALHVNFIFHVDGSMELSFDKPGLEIAAVLNIVAHLSEEGLRKACGVVVQ